MKHKDLESYFALELAEFVRPSKRNAIKEVMWGREIYNYKDLCAMKEEDFKRFPFVDDTFLARTKAHLEEYGLHFGMTGDEIVEYMDREYLAEHPEEAELAVEGAPADDGKDIEETAKASLLAADTAAEAAAGTTEQPKIKLPKRQDPLSDDYDVKESAYFHLTRLLNSTVKTLDDADFEFMRFRCLGYAYYNQPWYYRLLYSIDKRIDLAKEEADKLFVSYVMDATLRTLQMEKKIRLENEEAREDTD